MSSHRQKSSAFTLIELLVVIAIIAVLALVVILTLNPAELIRQARDSNRLTELNTINTAISLYNVDVGSLTGSSTTAYVSIPDLSATSTAGDHCEGLSLPALTSTWVYHCAASSTYRKADGTGWIPINFKAISSGAPLESLPVDPINTGNNYYTYAASGGSYEFTSIPESNKYTTNAVNDGGYNPFAYEGGSNLALSPFVRNQWTGVGDFEGDENGFTTYGAGVTNNWSSAYGSITGQSAEHILAASSLTNGNYGGIDSFYLNTFPTLTVGKKYGIFLYAKSLANPGMIWIMNQNGVGDLNCLSFQFTPTPQWAAYSTSCVLDAAKTILYIAAYSPSDEFIIDDLQIVALN